MRSLDELKSYYRRDLRQTIDRFERRRKNLLVQFIILAGVLLSVAILVGTRSVAGGVLLGMASFFGMVYYGTKRSSSYATEFKEQVLSRLVTFMSDSLTYEPAGYIDEAVFKTSRLFDRARHNRYTGDDLVHGTMDRLPVRFSELRVSNSGSDSSNTIFHGLFVEATMPHDFEGTTTVVPDVFGNMTLPQGLLGDLARNLIEKLLPEPHGEEVALDAPAFHRLFIVYSDAPEEARRVLDEDVRSNLIQLQEHLIESNTQGKQPHQRQSVRVGFREDKIYVAIDCRRALFPVTIFSKLKSYRLVDRFFQDMHLALSTVAAVRDMHGDHR